MNFIFMLGGGAFFLKFKKGGGGGAPVHRRWIRLW